MGSNKLSDPSGYWTNEKHLLFLNSMEASFVRRMFEHNGPLLRLDRYLPDSSESTLDSKNQRRRRRRHTTSDVLDPTKHHLRKTRRVSSQPCNSSQDQVVPQLENRGSDKDERDHANGPVAPANH